jgi:hypothetical protein
LPKADGAAPRYSAKLVTARFFMARMLPETATHLARIQAGAASTMELPEEGFWRAGYKKRDRVSSPSLPWYFSYSIADNVLNLGRRPDCEICECPIGRG